VKDLFGNEIVDPPRPVVGGHPARTGTGPEGETCGTCDHDRVVKPGQHRYHKCFLIRSNWTHGPGTDIRKKDKACQLWKAKEKS